MNSPTLLLIVCISISNFCFAQDSIKWLDETGLEMAIEKGDKPSFIFIKESEDERMGGMENDKRFKEMQSRMLNFLKDSNLITVLNENFNCYRFDPATDSITHKGTTYKKTEQRGRTSHEFITVLTDSDRNRLPAIVIRDKAFKLYEFKMRPSKLEEMKILLAAEELKANYLKEHLSEDNRTLQESGMMLERAQKQVESEDANLEKLDTSVFSGRQEASSLIKKLNYFLDDEYKTTDLKSFEKKK